MSSLRPTMSSVRSALSREQEKQLGSLLGHARLSLLYKASVHSYTAAAFHGRCDLQGPTVVVAYNGAGFVFGAFTSKDYTQRGQVIADDKAFLFSFREGDGGKSPLRVAPKSEAQAFTDGNTGPNFGSLVFLNGNQAAVASNPGSLYNFEAAEMHGGDLVLTECEVYRVEDLGGLLEKPWRNVLWSSDLLPTMSSVRSALSREQEKQLGSRLGHVRLSLLYKGSVHGYTAVAFHARCDRQGPTVVVAYNGAGFVFGAFTSKNYTQCGQHVADDKAFLFSFREGDGGKSPLRIMPKSEAQAFTDGNTGPNFGSLVFLNGNQAAVASYPGTFYNFEVAEMHGGDLVLTECEVYRVEDLGGLLEKPWRNILWRSDLQPTMSSVRSALSREQEKQLGFLLGHARLSLLYKGSVHGYTAAAFHGRCDLQGPTVVVAYNGAGFVFGAFTSKDYTQRGQVIADDKAFLFSFREGDGGKSPLRITPKSDAQAFTDGNTGPNFGSLVFLNGNQAAVASNPGTFYNFEAAELHGGDLVLTECEVYRVEDLGSLLEKPWRNVLWSSECSPAGAHDQGGRGVPARGHGSEAGVPQSLHPEEGGGVGPAPGDPHVLHHPGEELQPGAGPGPEQRHPAAHRHPADAEVHRQLLRRHLPGGGRGEQGIGWPAPPPLCV
ncbi:uncharacterized protein LOC135258127 isoform X3 [Anguilla rostrata]|uniref:uncharacterized protein LOC135258127 isoform X3 n=1 Tax=Anguilla rostrata TaxID=7938 RepID=UPI0030D1DB03